MCKVCEVKKYLVLVVKLVSFWQDGVLHRIVSRSQVPRSILAIVLKSEACDINLQNETGETALMVALEQVRLVATLVQGHTWISGLR